MNRWTDEVKAILGKLPIKAETNLLVENNRSIGKQEVVTQQTWKWPTWLQYIKLFPSVEAKKTLTKKIVDARTDRQCEKYRAPASRCRAVIIQLIHISFLFIFEKQTEDILKIINTIKLQTDYQINIISNTGNFFCKGSTEPGVSPAHPV